MEQRRWVNQSQPQTLQIAVMLFYINAVFEAIYGYLRSPIGILLVAGGVASGFGIANEKKWGYGLGIVMGLSPFVLRLLFHLGAPDILTLMFEIALIALLLHPQSRDYQRIWFK